MKSASDILTHHIGDILEEGAFKNVLIICLKDYATEAIEADRERVKLELRKTDSVYHDDEGFELPSEYLIDNLPIELK